jgi:putative nucleotidyltransferase with HDIG domain
MTQATVPSKPPASTELQWDTGCIPPFPGVALKTLKLMSGTDTSLIELCNLIRSDPSFSVAVLRIANSPLVAFPKAVTSVMQASMLLGFHRLRSVVITIGLKAYLNGSFTPLMKACWRHSVACAIIAERTAKLTFVDNDFAYTAGILHDIGRVALATLMPASYARVLERGAPRPQDVLAIERELCGIDHCQAGHSLITAWGLHQELAEIAAHHHDPEAHWTATAALVPPSCALADALGFAVVRCKSELSYAEILAKFPEGARRCFPATAKEFAAEIGTEIKVIESV